MTLVLSNPMPRRDKVAATFMFLGNLSTASLAVPSNTIVESVKESRSIPDSIIPGAPFRLLGFLVVIKRTSSNVPDAAA